LINLILLFQLIFDKKPVTVQSSGWFGIFGSQETSARKKPVQRIRGMYAFPPNMSCPCRTIPRDVFVRIPGMRKDDADGNFFREFAESHPAAKNPL
jgi:hypothetical protein